MIVKAFNDAVGICIGYNFASRKSKKKKKKKGKLISLRNLFFEFLYNRHNWKILYNSYYLNSIKTTRNKCDKKCVCSLFKQL